jgi:hypothetical protein
VSTLIGLSTAAALGVFPPINTPHTARPSDAGVELGAVPMFSGVDDDGQTNFLIQARKKLGDGMELGIQFNWPVGITADFNYTLLDTGSFALSVDPAVRPYYFRVNRQDAFVLWAFLPVIADLAKTESMVLTVNAKAAMSFAFNRFFSTAYPDDLIFYAGGGVGTKIKVGENGWIMPEFSMLYSFRANAMIWNVGVGFFFEYISGAASWREAPRMDQP